MKNELQNLKDVLTTGDFKPRNPTDFFSVRANFLLEIIVYAEKVEEMQKVLEQTRTGISNAYEFGYLKETDQNDVHNMIERINEVLKGESL